MKVGDKVDLILTADENGKPAVKWGEAGPEGTLHKIQEGRPLPGDAVLLKATTCLEHPDTLHAEVLHCPERKPRKAERAGPARVSTSKYRSGWDEIFGKKKPKKRQQPN